MSETRILRSRHAESILNLDRLDSPARSGSAKFLGTVVNAGSIPTAADKYCLVNPTEINGTETEGGAVTLTANTSIMIPGIVLGLAPVVGDRLVFTAIGGRWIARKYTSGGGGTPTPGFIACCPSNPVPTSLTLSFTFRGGTNAHTYNNEFQNTTLTYMTSPPSYAFGSGNRYFSPILTEDSTDQIYYSLSCTVGGQVGLGVGFANITSPSTCFGIALVSCSPFLATGIVGGLASPCLSTGFGTGTDNITIS
ncbi:MAG: hypothetical protein ACXWNW_13695 [Isosphaeraceae bacterium]